MTSEQPEDFAAEVDVDDSTRLSPRRPAAPRAEPERDATQMATRRRGAADPVVDDVTRRSERDVVTAVRSETSAPRSDSVPTRAAHPPFGVGGLRTPALPPGELPAGAPYVSEGGFGARTEAYRPRATPVASPSPVRSVAASLDATVTPVMPGPVLAPAEAQRRRESAHRATIAKAVAMGMGILVLGTAAVIGIVVLAGGLT